MKREFLYKKILTGGRPKYEPVREYDFHEKTWPYPGTHVVVVGEKSTIYKYDIQEDYAPLVAAATVMSEDIQKLLIDASMPSVEVKTPWTKEQLDAWENLKSAFNRKGDDLFGLRYPSSYDIANKIMQVIMERAKSVNTSQAAKDAFEHYLTIATLSRS